MALVSIIIPCYNAERYLQDTLDSVRSQTCGDWELILVNDGSSDGTAALVDACAAASPERVRVLHLANGGAAAARNAGLALARGDHVQYLDADDILLPDALASRLSALREQGADLAYGDWQRLVEGAAGVFSLRDICAHTLEEVHADAELATFTRFWSPPAALLYTRALVERIGPWQQRLAPVEDARYLQDAARQGARFVHVPGVMAHYRVFDGPSHSRRSPLRFARAVHENALDAEVIWRQSGRLDRERRMLLADCHGYCARQVYAHDRALFRQVLAAWSRQGEGGALAWPRLAGLCDRLLGHRLTLRLLALLGRPAAV